jgi:glutaredoxin
LEHVKGEDIGEVKLYAISTCAWCKKTKKLLKDLGVAYDFVDMDLLDENKKEEVEEEVKKCNPKLTYPTLKVNDDCILGFKKDEIKEALQ